MSLNLSDVIGRKQQAPKKFGLESFINRSYFIYLQGIWKHSFLARTELFRFFPLFFSRPMESTHSNRTNKQRTATWRWSSYMQGFRWNSGESGNKGTTMVREQWRLTNSQKEGWLHKRISLMWLGVYFKDINRFPMSSGGSERADERVA